MKYFTKEELEDITKELIENPTRETLKMLHEKYSIVEETNKTITDAIIEEPGVELSTTPTLEVPEVKNAVSLEMMPQQVEIAPLPTMTVEAPQVNPLPNLNISNMELPVEQPTKVVENVIEVPNFEMPKVEVSSFNNQNVEPMSISGNLWEKSKQEPINLMQTTDNFNSIQNTMPNTEIQISPAPFFVPNSEPVNNPIPIGGTLNSMPNPSPSMFGEMQQNYM